MPTLGRRWMLEEGPNCAKIMLDFFQEARKKLDFKRLYRVSQRKLYYVYTQPNLWCGRKVLSEKKLHMLHKRIVSTVVQQIRVRLHHPVPIIKRS